MDGLRLRWQRTWPERNTDLTGTDPARPYAIARVYRTHLYDAEMRWFWTVTDGFRDLGTGYCATWRRAIETAEARWRETIGG